MSAITDGLVLPKPREDQDASTHAYGIQAAKVQRGVDGMRRGARYRPKSG
jgi:hypothetical protein